MSLFVFLRDGYPLQGRRIALHGEGHMSLWAKDRCPSRHLFFEDYWQFESLLISTTNSCYAFSPFLYD